MEAHVWTRAYENRRTFIGGSDAPIIMGSDEAALVRLWREKRGGAEPEDLSGNLLVQLGAATEEFRQKSSARLASELRAATALYGRRRGAVSSSTAASSQWH